MPVAAASAMPLQVAVPIPAGLVPVALPASQACASEKSPPYAVPSKARLSPVVEPPPPQAPRARVAAKAAAVGDRWGFGSWQAVSLSHGPIGSAAPIKPITMSLPARRHRHPPVSVGQTANYTGNNRIFHETTVRY